MTPVEFAPDSPRSELHEIMLVDLPEVSVAITMISPDLPVPSAGPAEIPVRPDHPIETSMPPAGDMIDWYDNFKIPVDELGPPDQYGLAG